MPPLPHPAPPLNAAVSRPVSSPPSVACQVELHSFAAPAVIQGGVEEGGGEGDGESYESKKEGR